MSRCSALAGVLSWRGYHLPVAVPGPVWLEWLADFTGIDVTTTAGGAADATPPVLSVVDDRHALVDGVDMRSFSGVDDLKAWLFLTVSDVMITRGRFTAFHAATLIVDDRAVLVSGAPWSGKSSWAFEALRLGVGVLGDDQVCVDAAAGVVQGLPRPMKRRLIAGAASPRPSTHAVRARLDDEVIAIEPRRTGGLMPVDRCHAVGLVIHLARHRGTGVEITAMDRFATLQAVLPQMRGEPSGFLAATAAAARVLARVPNVRMSVGDGEIGRGLDMAVALIRDEGGPTPLATDVIRATAP